MRLILKSLCCGVIICCIISMTGFYGACGSIEEEVFRLHILANSDSEEDQQLKLKVRDGVISYTDSLFNSCKSKEEAMALTEAHIEDIRQCAKSIIEENGSDYPVEACITKMHFDTRVYEDFTLPAGRYDALRIIIGSGQGHNWWCMIFPALCFPSAEDKRFDNVMNEGEKDIVEHAGQYEVKFRLVEWLEGVFSFFG